MKFIFSLFIIAFMSKECNNSKEGLAIKPNDVIENASEKDTSNTIQIQSISGTYNILFLKENNTQSLGLTMSFDEKSNKVSGFAGCNRFSGTYIIKKDSIAFSRIISTKMYCEKTQNIEDLMFKYLSKVNSFSLQENTLVLKNGTINLLTAKKEGVEKVQNDIVIEYSTLSRGSYKMIQLSNKNISVQKSRSSKMMTKDCNDEEWNKIIDLVNALNLKNLSTLKAPSQARLYDGAAIANLKVIYNGATYNVPPFDHGKPANEIEAIVNQILSIAGNIE